MHIISRLFGKSPFSPLKNHMVCISRCVEKLAEIIAFLPSFEDADFEKKVDDLCQFKHEADLKKTEILHHFPKDLFIPIDRSDFFDILSIQNEIGDIAEKVGIFLSFRSIEFTLSFQTDIEVLLQKNIETFLESRKIIQEIDDLVEASFGGIEAKKVHTLVERTSRKEYDAKVFLRMLMKKCFIEESPSPSLFYLKIKTIENIGALSSLSEKLATRILMLLEL